MACQSSKRAAALECNYACKLNLTLRLTRCAYGENVKLMPLSQFLASRQNKRRPAKIAVTIRYSHEVLEAFKSTGEGWQVRMDTALKDWLKNNNPNDAKI